MEKTKRPRQEGDLDAKLHNQMEHLMRSCIAFDIGHENEAERISVTLRILLHNFGSSHSLLAQLNLLDQLKFVDSGVRRELLNKSLEDHFNTPTERVISYGGPYETGLVSPVIVENKGKYLANLTRNRFSTGDPRFSCITATRDFEDWWSTPFIETSKRKLFSRSDIVRTMADQNGGAHVDPQINAEFDDFIQDVGDLQTDQDGTGLKVFESNIAHSTLRQIAFEVMATIDDFLGTTWVEQTRAGRPARVFQPMLLPFAIIKPLQDE